LDEQERAIIFGYVNGFDRRIQEIRLSTDQLPFKFSAVNVFPEDWHESDVLAIFSFIQRNFDPEALDQDQVMNGMLLQQLMERFPQHFLGMFNDLRWVNDSTAQTFIGPKPLEIKQVAVAANPEPSWETRLKTQSTIGDLMNATLPNFEKAGSDRMARRKKLLENLKKINARVKMGSYAWVVSGEKTSSGNPILYTGPQMGFSVPSIIAEGSICAAG
jgi:penicillin amidase